MGILSRVKLKFKRSSGCPPIITTIWKCMYMHKGQIRITNKNIYNKWQDCGWFISLKKNKSKLMNLTLEQS